MRCLECGSEAVTERPERTAQGYRRFRCRACGKPFNERSGGVLNRTQYPSDVIALVGFCQGSRQPVSPVLDEADPGSCGLQDGQHGHAAEEELESAAVGGHVLMVAGARAEKVAEFIVSATEPSG